MPNQEITTIILWYRQNLNVQTGTQQSCEMRVTCCKGCPITPAHVLGQALLLPTLNQPYHSACPTVRHGKVLNGQGIAHIFERISFHLDRIQDLAPGKAA